MASPLITVIVTAHNRRKYIKRALDSVRSQTLSRDKYEVLVVSNFEDKYEGLNNLRWIHTEEEGLGAKIAIGLEEAKGDIVSILEDDDLWLPDKLRLVRNYFRSEKQLVYLHNNLVFIDDDLILLPRSLQRITYRCARDFRAGPAMKGLTISNINWALSCLFFNNSSMTFRKDLILNDGNLLRVMKKMPGANGIDHLLAVYLVNAGRALHISNVLTLYNVHYSTYWANPERLRTRDPLLELIKMGHENCAEAMVYEFIKETAEEVGAKRLLTLLLAEHAPICDAIRTLYGKRRRWLPISTLNTYGVIAVNPKRAMANLLAVLWPRFAIRLLLAYKNKA